MGKGAIPRQVLTAGLALLLGAIGLTGCRAGPSSPVPAAAQVVEVVAGVFPLAELAHRVGLDRVRVNDLSAGGADPRAVKADPATVRAIDRAGVILLVGGGFQPDIEQAATGRPNALMVRPAAGGPDPHVWLDPVAMEHLATMVANSLSRADPAGRSAYQAAARVYTAQLGALDIDYRTSLADCARHDLVTADGAFAGLAKRYGLIGHTVADPGILQVLAGQRVSTIFTEPLVPTAPAEDLARQAHLKTEVLETLESRTPAQVSRAATYLSLMTDDLAKLRTAQACTGGTPT